MERGEYTDIFFKDYYFSDFYCFNVGQEACSPNYRFGPTLRENYVLHLVAKGQGKFQKGSQVFQLKAGDVFLIRPNELCVYQADEADPWEYYWLGFSGSKAGELLALNGFGGDVATGQVADLAGTIQKFTSYLAADFFNDQLAASNQSLFLQLFAQLALSQKGKLAVKTISSKEKYREAFILYVANNFSRSNLSIEEIARSLYLNPAYFSQLIKEELGITALEYLQTYRMNQAGAMVTATDLSIEAIAEAVGYQNRHSFSRIFKDKFKVTPSNYRKSN